MDDWRSYGPSSGTWIEAYDPETGKAERVQLCLPILLPSYILRRARPNEVRLIRGRTRRRFYSLTFMGFQPLIMAEETLGIIGVRCFNEAAEIPITRAPRRQRLPMPEPAQVERHRVAVTPYN